MDASSAVLTSYRDNMAGKVTILMTIFHSDGGRREEPPTGRLGESPPPHALPLPFGSANVHMELYYCQILSLWGK